MNAADLSIVGKRVQATYHGHQVSGVIESSRCKYGGAVQHTLALDKPLSMRWRKEAVSYVLVDSDDVKVVD